MMMVNVLLEHLFKDYGIDWMLFKLLLNNMLLMLLRKGIKKRRLRFLIRLLPPLIVILGNSKDLRCMLEDILIKL